MEIILKCISQLHLKRVKKRYKSPVMARQGKIKGFTGIDDHEPVIP